MLIFPRRRGSAAGERAEALNPLDLPRVSGYNRPPTVASDSQRLAGQPDLADQDPVRENREGSVTAAEDVLGFRDDRVNDLDPDTARLNMLKERLTALEKNHKALQDADAQSWSVDRITFEQQLSVLREDHVRVPQARERAGGASCRCRRFATQDARRIRNHTRLSPRRRAVGRLWGWSVGDPPRRAVQTMPAALLGRPG